MSVPASTRALRAAAMRSEPSFRRLVRGAARDAKAALRMTALVRAFDTGFPPDMAHALEGSVESFEASLATASEFRVAEGGFEKLFLRALRRGARAVRVADMRFDATNPEAVAWAKRNAATLVTETTAATRLAIRRIIQRTFAEGISSRDAAILIRDVIGLTERQAEAVANFRKKLVERQLNKTAVRRRTSRYADKLLRDRATTIARTESMRAANEGQRQLWKQAVSEGYLSSNAQQQWITTPDERLCPVCGPLEGETVNLNASFSGGFTAPPAHPRCRCTVALVPGSVRKPQRAA